MIIDELTLSTNHLLSLRDFYSDRLRLPLLESSSQRIALQAGGTRLIFEQSAQHCFYHFAFNIPENQFAEARAWALQYVALIRDKNGRDQFGPDDWDAHRLYFYDPAGNIVELIARHSLACASNHPFTVDSILNVSEIGIVADDVNEAVRVFQTSFGILPYSDANDTFAPLGDEYGLLIVVKRGRIWFPDTGKAASFYPTIVSMTTPLGKRELVAESNGVVGDVDSSEIR